MLQGGVCGSVTQQDFSNKVNHVTDTPNFPGPAQVCVIKLP
jgi:hypothetical protein